MAKQFTSAALHLTRSLSSQICLQYWPQVDAWESIRTGQEYNTFPNTLPPPLSLSQPFGEKWPQSLANQCGAHINLRVF